MEIKKILNKPCSKNERLDFIVKQNHILGYEIKETDSRIEAWGKTQEEIEEIKKEKFKNNWKNLTKSELEQCVNHL